MATLSDVASDAFDAMQTVAENSADLGSVIVLSTWRWWSSNDADPSTWNSK